MSMPIPDSIERLLYWQGQKLLSGDFNDQLATNAQMRWWHNRALHSPYGVRIGLKVTYQVGNNFVTVPSGLAYDCFGRELILQVERNVDFPPLQIDNEGANQEKSVIWLLVIRYKETSEYVSVRGLSDVCVACDNLATREDVVLEWLPEEKFSLTDGVPIARVKFGVKRDGYYDVPEVNSSPILARPLARPRIGSGITVPGDTAWMLWAPSSGKSQKPVGVQVVIDTSASGFTTPPCYFARLQGQLWDKRSRNDLYFPVPFDHIANTSVTRFTFRLWLPEFQSKKSSNGELSVAEEFIIYARNQKLYVSWLGVQIGCE